MTEKNPVKDRALRAGSAIQTLARSFSEDLSLRVIKVVVEGQNQDLLIRTCVGEVCIHFDGTNILQKRVDERRKWLEEAEAELAKAQAENER